MSERVVEAQVEARRGAFHLDVAFTAPVGTTVVFGASGAGKSTLLRAIAGLEPAEGRIVVGGATWLDTAQQIQRPPHKRETGFVFQFANLLPHLDVEHNLRYGARRATGPGPDFDEVVEGLALRPLLGRRTEGLSGGERQRVALGRALVRRPRVLLFDEPLSALDEPARRELMSLLLGMATRYGLPHLHVTHALDEAQRIGDRMLWIHEGRLRDAGPLAQVVASTAFLRTRGSEAGVVADGRVVERVAADHLLRVTSPWGELWVSAGHGDGVAPAPVGSALRLRVLAGDVSLGMEVDPHSSLLNQLPLVVVGLGAGEVEGQTLVRLAARGDDGARTPLVARVTTRSARHLGLAVGQEVVARVKAVAVLV